jgi:CheY-like chemotaxis protein
MSFGGLALRGQEGSKLHPLKCRDGSQPSVLLAEDSPAARILTGALLKRIGCIVDTAEHGEEALCFVRENAYDLVIMDIEMPVMDGVVAAREIRTLKGDVAKTPIIALSAFLADTKRSDFWNEHFDIALSKPAGKHQLHSTITKVLEAAA